MVRVPDARMSGTAFGTGRAACDACGRGRLALVENGDMIELDVENRH